MMLHLASQGLPAAIHTLRQLGRRVSRQLDCTHPQRPGGMRSASVLAEFSKACRIPIFLSELDSTNPTPPNGAAQPVDVPMLQSLPRKAAALPSTDNLGFMTDMAAFDQWLIAATEHDGVFAT